MNIIRFWSGLDFLLNLLNMLSSSILTVASLSEQGTIHANHLHTMQHAAPTCLRSD